MLVRGPFGLEDMPECDEPSACHNVNTFYSAEHDNFYCGTCRKGQGNDYHARNYRKPCAQDIGPKHPIGKDGNDG